MSATERKILLPRLVLFMAMTALVLSALIPGQSLWIAALRIAGGLAGFGGLVWLLMALRR